MNASLILQLFKYNMQELSPPLKEWKSSFYLAVIIYAYTLLTLNGWPTADEYLNDAYTGMGLGEANGAWCMVCIKNNQDGMGRNKLGKGFDFLSIV